MAVFYSKRPARFNRSLPNYEQEKQIKLTKNMVYLECQKVENVQKNINPTFYILKASENPFKFK
jgi:hypothetical protein